MKHIITIVLLLAIAIYHIKSTDYTITSYLIQIGLGLLTYRIYITFRDKRNKRSDIAK